MKRTSRFTPRLARRPSLAFARLVVSPRAIARADDDRAPAPTLAERERAPFATLRATHLDAVDAMVRQLDALSDEEARAREAFEAEWDARLADFRARRDALESKMRDRHRDALEATRETLGAPSPARRDGPRSSRRCVDLERRSCATNASARRSTSSSASATRRRRKWRRTASGGAPRTRARSSFAFEAREERAVLAREADAEEERLKARRAKALRAATREWGRRAEEEAARRLRIPRRGASEPIPERRRESGETKVEVEVDAMIEDDGVSSESTMPPRARTGSARDDSDPHAEYRTVQIRIRLRIFPPGRRDFRRGRARAPGDPLETFGNAKTGIARNHWDRRARANTRVDSIAVRGGSSFGTFGTFGTRVGARDESRRVVGGFFPRAFGRVGGARVLSKLGRRRGYASAVVLRQRRRRAFHPGRDSFTGRDSNPGRGRVDFHAGTRFLRGTGFPGRDGIPAEDADASRRLSESSRGAGADVVHPPVIGSIPAGSRFDPALQHMVSLEQRRAWEEMRRGRAMMDEAHARGSRARAGPSSPGDLRAPGSNRLDRGRHPRRHITPDDRLLRPRWALRRLRSPGG